MKAERTFMYVRMANNYPIKVDLERFENDIAFAECHALTYIPSRSSLKEIDGGAFAECEIDDPGDLTGIMVDEYVFFDCHWSESPNNPALENYVDPEEDSAE